MSRPIPAISFFIVPKCWTQNVNIFFVSCICLDKVSLKICHATYFIVFFQQVNLVRRLFFVVFYFPGKLPFAREIAGRVYSCNSDLQALSLENSALKTEI